MVQSDQDACPVSACSVGLDDGVGPQGTCQLDLPHPDGARVIKGAGLVRVRRLVRATVLHELTLYRPACGTSGRRWSCHPPPRRGARKFPPPVLLGPSTGDVIVEARAELHPDAADHRASFDFHPVSL